MRKVKAIIKNQLQCEDEELKGDALLIDDLGMDSLDIVELTMDIELAYNMIIENWELEKLKTVKDIVDFVEEKFKGENR